MSLSAVTTETHRGCFLGGEGSQQVLPANFSHNFAHQVTDEPRIVICTINNGQIGVGLPFQVILSHRSIYGDESA